MRPHLLPCQNHAATHQLDTRRAPTSATPQPLTHPRARLASTRPALINTCPPLFPQKSSSPNDGFASQCVRTCCHAKITPQRTNSTLAVRQPLPRHNHSLIDKGQERGGRRMNRSELEMANWKVN